MNDITSAEKLAEKYCWRELRELRDRRKARRKEFFKLGAPKEIIWREDRMMIEAEIAMELSLGKK